MIASLNIDLILISAFLILNLGLGLWYGKGVKSMKGFALGGRNFSTTTLTATIVATWVSGYTFNAGIENTYTLGILGISLFAAQVINLYIIALLAPRMQEFLGKLSIPEVMGHFYGVHIRIITAISCIAITIIKIAVQTVINMLNLAHSSIKQLISYSNNLFDLSQFEKRKMVFNIELHNLKLLMQEVVNECNKIYGNSTRIITLDYHSSAETVFELDYLRMRQVMLNLIANAVQYSPSGVIQVKVMPYRQGAQIIIEDEGEIIIEDEGVGIPDRELEKIFEPFEESSYTKSQATGRGLGLAVAREIVLHHHGTICASNRIDRQGSKFTVQLPMRQPQGGFNKGIHSKNKIFGNPQTYEQRIKGIVEETPALQQKINTVQSLSDVEDHVRTNKAIMIIDDDQSFLDAVSLSIYAECYKATPVNNPFEAIKLVRETPEFYSMILLAMNMPGKTGDKTLRAINDVTGMYSIPVIIVADCELPYDTRILLYSLGASVIISKPCTKDDIRDLINRYLRPSATALFTPSNFNKYGTT